MIVYSLVQNIHTLPAFEKRLELNLEDRIDV